jgi:uncharacterized protein (TIGR02118 family)
MVKLVYCVARRADVPAEAFRRHWLEQHGPLVRTHARALRARRYVQSHTLTTDANEMLRASRDSAERYDGSREGWWDSLAEFSAAMDAPEARAAATALLEDEKRFIDITRSAVFFTEEHTIFEL